MECQVIMITGAKILLIEDDPVDVKLFMHSIRDVTWVHDVRSVGSAEAALETLEAGNWRPDFVLLDLNLPGMSGLEFLEKIRGHSQWQELPVLVLTSSKVPQDLVDSVTRSAAGFLLKPADEAGFNKMCETLKECWKKWGRSEAVKPQSVDTSIPPFASGSVERTQQVLAECLHLDSETQEYSALRIHGLVTDKNEYTRYRRGELGQVSGLVALGRQLVLWRLRSGLSVDDFARLLGVTVEQVVTNEADHYRDCSLNQVQEALTAVGLTADVFMRKTEL